MDFNRIAAEYARHRKAHPEVLKALVERPPVTSVSWVLEIGCGTGNYINAIQADTGCSAWGIDPAEDMLAVARERGPEVKFSSGRAEAVTVNPGGFSFVFSVDIIHIIPDRRAYFEQAAKALWSGGSVCTVTDSEDIIRSRLPMTKYFPETVDVDMARYPRVHEIEELMREEGFDRIRTETVSFEADVTDIGVWKNRACSTLNLIPEDAFRRGLERMEADLATGPIRWRSRYAMIWGRKRES